MSRIGNAPIVLPEGVDLSVSADNNVVVKGPKGQLEQKVDSLITVTNENGHRILTRANESG